MYNKINRMIKKEKVLEKEEIRLTPARNVNSEITPSTHTGKQILIDPDKLVFNTKEGNNNNVGIYSGYNLNLISKNERYLMVPCSYEDYVQATNGEVPNRWWKNYQKLIV